MATPGGGTAEAGGESYDDHVTSTGGASAGEQGELPALSFQRQVALWMEVWSADRPDLVDRARAEVDPERDPWGYLAVLGQLLADAA